MKDFDDIINETDSSESKLVKQECSWWVEVQTSDGKYSGFTFPKKGDSKLFLYPTVESSANPVKSKSGKTIMVKVSELIGMEKWPY
jgi:hypothetical protein